MNISAASYSARGNRTRNEDTVSLLLGSRGNVVAIAADGLGGEGNGDIASQTAVQTINARLSGTDITMEAIEKAIVSAHEAIVKLQDSKNRMKTTVAVLHLDDRRVLTASVGDTRIYQFRNDKVLYQSTDHSVSQMSVSVGEIDADKIRGHVDRHRLTLSLGARKRVEVDATELVAAEGDAFLLCSDGFWEHVLEEEMCEDLKTAGSADNWLNKMRCRIELRIPPKGDNHSAIALMVGNKPKKPGEAGGSKKPNKPKESMEPNKPNESKEANESNKSNKSKEPNKPNESKEPNKSNEPKEPN
jgi:serine/threonine protein phosphatase PrpC